MKTIRIALPILVVAAATCPAQTNTADHFVGLGATLFDTLSVAGGQVGPSNSLAFGQATAAGQYSIALGYGAYAQHDRAFVWAGSSETGMASTTPGQFIVYAPGGIHLLGGTIHGNGSTLSGINASNLVGLGSAALKPYTYFAPVSAGNTAIGASNLANTANNRANSAYNTAVSALQSDGRVDWTGTQNAAGQSLTNLQGAFAMAVTQGTFQVTANRLTGLVIGDPNGYGFPYTGHYGGDVTNGFFGPASIVHDESWNWSIVYSVSSWVGFDVNNDTGWFWAGGWSLYYSVQSIYEDGFRYPYQVDIYSGSPYDGSYSGNEYSGFTRSDGACALSTDGCGTWWMVLPTPSSLCNCGVDGYPAGYFYIYDGSSSFEFDVQGYFENVTWNETRPVTNAIPFEVADGRNAWTGTHDAGGQLLRNLQDAYTYAVTDETVQMIENRMTGLLVSDPYESGFPYPGVHSGDVTNGFYDATSITHDAAWNWWMTWGEPTSEFVGWIDPYYSGWFMARGYSVGYTGHFNEWSSLDGIVLTDGSPFDGNYYGDIWNGFTREDGVYSLTPDGQGGWIMNSPWTECIGLGGTASGGHPAGDFSGGSGTWTFSIAPHFEDVTWQETHPVTNAVAFEAADGRHAWVGNHNAGGFDLGNVGTLQAEVVVGDGSGLFNVGLAALDVASIDLRYLLKAGDTVTGDLEVNGALTVGGRSVATLTRIPPQGDIAMGSFTNVPAQP